MLLNLGTSWGKEEMSQEVLEMIHLFSAQSALHEGSSSDVILPLVQKSAAILLQQSLWC